MTKILEIEIRSCSFCPNRYEFDHCVLTGGKLEFLFEIDKKCPLPDKKDKPEPITGEWLKKNNYPYIDSFKMAEIVNAHFLEK